MVARKHGNRYSEETRALALKRMSNGESVSEVATSMGMHPSILYSWMKGKKRKSESSPRRSPAPKRGIFGLLAFAADELGKTRPNIDVARAYIILARHELAEKDE